MKLAIGNIALEPILQQVFQGWNTSNFTKHHDRSTVTEVGIYFLPSVRIRARRVHFVAQVLLRGVASTKISALHSHAWTDSIVLLGQQRLKERVHVLLDIIALLETQQLHAQRATIAVVLEI
jgi:hypothetical protein